MPAIEIRKFMMKRRYNWEGANWAKRRWAYKDVLAGFRTKKTTFKYDEWNIYREGYVHILHHRAKLRARTAKSMPYMRDRGYLCENQNNDT